MSGPEYNVIFETSSAKVGDCPPCDRPEVALIGRSNVGKSSLLNALAGQKNLARVSGEPGKTALINSFVSEALRLIDLPGYGYAKVSKNQRAAYRRLIDSYLFGERDYSLVVLLIDARHKLQPIDCEMIERFVDGEVPFAIAFTKADKLSKTAREQNLAAFAADIPYFGDIHAVLLSAKTGEGLDDLKALIAEAIFP